MGEYIFKGDYTNTVGIARVNLLLIHFKDENGVDFIYSPHLDITGYGRGLKAAKKSFEIVFEDFIDYTLKKKTLSKVLTKLGWEINGNPKRLKQLLAPSIASVIRENDYVSELFDTYPVQTYHQEVGIPAMT